MAFNKSAETQRLKETCSNHMDDCFKAYSKTCSTLLKIQVLTLVQLNSLYLFKLHLKKKKNFNCQNHIFVLEIFTISTTYDTIQFKMFEAQKVCL